MAQRAPKPRIALAKPPTPGANSPPVRLLDRYLLRELLVPLGYCLGGFLIFYVSFDLIFQINRFLDAHLLFWDIVEYYVVTLPELLVEEVLPVSLLLALLYATTNHSRYNELTAMRAAGEVAAPATVAEALAIHHIARDRAAALLA